MKRKQIKFSLNRRFRVPQTNKAVTSPQLIATERTWGTEESAIVNILFANRMVIASAKGPKRKQKVARGEKFRMKLSFRMINLILMRELITAWKETLINLLK